jgi:hypothetical protein
VQAQATLFRASTENPTESPTTEEPPPRWQAQATPFRASTESPTTEEPSPRRQAQPPKNQPPKEQREKREQREQRGNEKKREKVSDEMRGEREKVRLKYQRSPPRENNFLINTKCTVAFHFERLLYTL